MKVCSELGDLNSHLVPFDDPEDFEFFYKKGRLNPAVQRYCSNQHKKNSCLKGIATMETGRCSGFHIKTGELGLILLVGKIIDVRGGFQLSFLCD